MICPGMLFHWEVVSLRLRPGLRRLRCFLEPLLVIVIVERRLLPRWGPTARA